MNKKSTINIDEIRNVFKESCEKGEEVFSETRFQEFLKFLEIDFYDWVKENLKHFHSQK